ncbi:hypothetical protein BJ165DRAFT_1458954, partial [Panaeolus papilionaceus]
MWINLFLLHVCDEISTSDPGGKIVVLSPEHDIPPTPLSFMSRHTLSGFINYAVILTSTNAAGMHILISLKYCYL